MRLVIISNLFPPHVRGGAEQVAAASARALAARGHEVSVITACPPKLGAKRYEVEEAQWEGLKVFRFFPHELYFTLDDHKQKYSTRMLWHVQDAFNAYSAGVVRKLLKRLKPDVVITHNLKGIGLLVPSVIRELRIPHVHTLHDVQLIEPSGLMTPATEARNWFVNLPFSVYRTVTRLLFRSPSLVLSPTQWLADLHDEHLFFPKSRFAVIRNPVPTHVRTEHSEPSLAHRFVFVGQLEEHKGILELLRAWQEAEKDPTFKAELDVIGDGTLMKRIREEVGVHERIRFHGRLPNEKVMRLVSEATALVFPSKCMENAPGAILEALSLGVPVLASEVGGVPEFVKENQSGWLVPAGDVDALARGLRRAATHPKEVAVLRQYLQSQPGMSLEKYAEMVEIECQNLLTK